MGESKALRYWNGILRLTKTCDEFPIRVPFGVKEGSDEVINDFLINTGNILVHGTTGSGKSIFLHSLLKSASIYNTLEEVNFVLVDSKRVEYTKYKNSEFLYCPIIHTENQFLEMLDELLEKIKRRKHDMGELSFEELREKREKFYYPYILVVVDEYLDITNEEIDKKLKELLRSGPTCGVYVALSVQRLYEKVFNQEMLDLFPTKICQMTFIEDDMKLLVGEYIELNGQGDSIVNKNNESFRVKNLYIKNMDSFIDESDEAEFQDAYWIMELLAKHNEDVLVPYDRYNEYYYDDHNHILTIFNPGDCLRADMLDKNRKKTMKFWDLMFCFKGFNMSVRLANNKVAIPIDQLFKSPYLKWYEKYKK